VDFDEELQVEEDDDVNEDIPLLQKAMLNERSAPEILPYEEQLVVDMHEAIENQQGHIDEARDKGDDIDEEFAISLYQMEIDRVKYLLVSYLRSRLAKIEKHVLHIMGSQELSSRLSEREKLYARRYMDMMESHFNDSVLNSFPAKFRALHEKKADNNMIDEPDLDSFVFCKVTTDLGELQMDERGDQRTVLEEGDVHILRYRPVRELVADGSIELI
jgi:GINS complex subunit 4